MFSDAFKALSNEAKFTREVLGSGVTQIRKANYANQGMYFQAFSSISTGLERIGKLCLMVDYYICNREFPDFKYMKNQIGHDLEGIYKKSRDVVISRNIDFEYLDKIDGLFHNSILNILSKFAIGDRYSNINLLVGARSQSDPIASWYSEVDEPIYRHIVNKTRKSKIERNAKIISSALSEVMHVLHVSELGKPITSIEEASIKTGMFEAVSPYRQLFVLQIIRYWVELLNSLQYIAMSINGDDIPYFSEIFSIFNNSDQYLRTRRNFEKI